MKLQLHVITNFEIIFAALCFYFINSKIVSLIFKVTFQNKDINISVHSGVTSILKVVFLKRRLCKATLWMMGVLSFYILGFFPSKDGLGITVSANDTALYFKCNFTCCNSVNWLLKLSLTYSDDKELFLWYGWPTKGHYGLGWDVDC